MDRRLGAFEILPDPVTRRGHCRLGEGTFGITYKAQDRLGHEVALKILKFDEKDPKAQRFENEAKVLYKLQHPHIARFLHYDIHKGYPYCCLEFCSGGNLQAIAQERKGLPLPILLKIGKQVCEALSYAHQRPDGAVIHRDIKPENLMLGTLDSGGYGVKVIDFGLAKVFSEETDSEDGVMRSAEGFKGTSLFASPEQWRETEIDGRADLYSLGMTLWYLACGDKPTLFEGKSLAEISSLHLSEKAFEFEGVDSKLIPLLRRLLAKKPSDRYSDAAVALEAFSHAIETGGFDVEEYDLSSLAQQKETGAISLESSLTRLTYAFSESGYNLREKCWETSIGPVFSCQTPIGNIAFLLMLEDGEQSQISQFDRESHYWQFLQLRQSAQQGTLPATLIEARNFSSYSDGVTCVELEPLWAVSLREVIRRRKKLTFSEAVLLLPHLAVAMDFLSERQMPVPDLSDSRLLISLIDPRKFSELGTFIDENLAQWPRFVLKVLPFGSSASSDGDDLESVDVTATYDAAEESAAFTGLSRFAAKVYSLLAGHQVAHAAFFTFDAYSEIPGLSPDGNVLLQDVICARGTINASCRDLLLSLCQTEGVTPPDSLLDTSLVSRSEFETVIDKGAPEPGLSSMDPFVSRAPKTPPKKLPKSERATIPVRPIRTSKTTRRAIFVIAAILLLLLGGAAAFQYWSGTRVGSPRKAVVNTESKGDVTTAPSSPSAVSEIKNDSDLPKPMKAADTGQKVTTAQTPSVAPETAAAQSTAKAAGRPSELIVPDTVPTIAEAIQKAADGETITVRGGEYRENLLISKPVHIMGSDQAGGVVILAPSVSESAVTIENTGGVYLKNLKLTHPSDETSGKSFPPVMLVRASEVRLDHCEFRGSAGDGLKATGEGTKLTCSDSIFASNAQHGLLLERGTSSEINRSRFESNGGSGLVASVQGTSVMATENSFLANKYHGSEINLGAHGDFRDCSFAKNQEVGLYALGEGTIVSLSSGIFESNRVSGICIEDGATADIQETEVFDSGASGIVFSNNPGSGSRVSGNKITNNTGWGASILAKGPLTITFENNICAKNLYSGIIVDGDVDILIKGNECLENKEHGIDLSHGTKGIVSGNTFQNNVLYGIVLDQVADSLVLGENHIDGNGNGSIERTDAEDTEP